MHAVMPTMVRGQKRGDYSTYSCVIIAEMLLEHGTDVNARNNHGETALLHMFSLICHVEEDEAIYHVQHLIAHGADINAKNDNGCTILNYALSGPNPKLRQFLIDAGAKEGEECPPGFICL
jgi:ankyrin repeat protein